jgi:hypothetical protein
VRRAAASALATGVRREMGAWLVRRVVQESLRVTAC